MSEKQYQLQIKSLLKEHGWTVHTTYDPRHVNPKGFPDITAWNSRLERMLFAEIKDTDGDVSAEQKAILNDLSLIPGIETYVWYPSDWPSIYEMIAGTALPERKWYRDRERVQGLTLS